MGQGGLELELKLTGAPGDVAALAQSRILRALAGADSEAAGEWRRLKSAYHDTPDRQLARAGIALRVRNEGGRAIQAVKRVTAAGAIVREEFETEIAAASAMPALTGNDDIDAVLESAAPSLAPSAVIVVDRWTQPCVFDGSRFEIAIDLGRAEGAAPGQAAPIAEVELEYVDGEMAELFELARLLVDNADLRLAARSKLETAHALSGAGLFAIDKFKKPAIDGDAPAYEAVQAMIAAAAIRVISLQGPILDIRAVEGVHQMRVALRRFRSVERVFRRGLEGEGLRPLAWRARDIARGLGPARDLDVFVEETSSDLFARDDAPSPEALNARAERMRAEAWRDAHELVSSKTFSHFVIDLLEAGVLAPWRGRLTERGRLPLKEFAPAALDRALKKARRAEAEMDRTALASRHPLRIALKKLRYAAQFFGPLYPRERRKPYMALLSALQEALGAVNDAVVAQRIADAAGAGAGNDAMRAAGFISGFKAAEAEAAAAEIDRAWSDFSAAAPFWRDD